MIGFTGRLDVMVRYAILVISVAALVFGCASSFEVHHDWDRDADFTQYKTFSWLERETPKAGSARVTQRRNPLLEKRIQSAVEGQLTSKGLVRVEGTADLVVAYHTGREDKIDISTYGYRYGCDYWGYGGREIDVYHYKEGTLIVDLIDSRSRELVWRGSATGTVKDNPTADQLEKKLNEVVKKLFQEYPPKQ